MRWNAEDLIVYEDRDVVVVRKPAGLASESARVTEADLYSILRARYGEIFLVHRLDQPVEGLMAAARTGSAAAALGAQLADGRMRKRYLARVSGRIPPEGGTLTDYLVRDGQTNTSRVVPAGAAGASGGRRRADTPKKAVLTFRRAAGRMLEVELATGRHHQIRVQLSHAGMPIDGDRKYGGQEAERLCLCAAELSFCHPVTGKRMEFRTEPSFRPE